MWFKTFEEHLIDLFDIAQQNSLNYITTMKEKVFDFLKKTMIHEIILINKKELVIIIFGG